MTQIEALTGISAHKLRMWERRYDFLIPLRTETNIRYYTGEHLKKLLNIGILTRNGFRISKIGKMSDDEIHVHVLEILSKITNGIKDEINALILSMMDFNEIEFNTIFQRNVIRKGFMATITDLIYPFLNHIGILWGANKLIPAQEHFISNLIRQKIISAIEELPLPSKDAPGIVLFLLEGEDHEIGLLIASFIAKKLGWKVYYLGQKVPSKNITNVLELTKPHLMMTFLINPRREVVKDLMEVLDSQKNVKALISGNMDLLKTIKTTRNIHLLENPNEYIQFLQKHMELV